MEQEEEELERARNKVQMMKNQEQTLPEKIETTRLLLCREQTNNKELRESSFSLFFNFLIDY